jgi:hypothetical protein
MHVDAVAGMAAAPGSAADCGAGSASAAPTAHTPRQAAHTARDVCGHAEVCAVRAGRGLTPHRVPS